MRVKTLQILWHDKEPIFSVDFEPGTSGRLATAGGDHNVRIWKLVKEDDQPPSIEFLSSLTRHTGAVNCVRWSPKGGVLASGGDDGTILLWQQTERKDGGEFGEQDSETKETWRIGSILRGASSDLYDLAWSPDATYIISACTDNTTRIFDVKEQRCIQVLTDHGHFVQGVAWDPLGKYVVTQSSDRSVNVYTYEHKKGQLTTRVAARLTKYNPSKLASRSPAKTGELDANQDTMRGNSTDSGNSTATPAQAKPFRIYHDETLTSFFRRPTFTPDGALLITPSGVFREPGDGKPDSSDAKNTVYIFTRGRITGQPVAHSPGQKKPSVAVRCSPVPYQLRTIPTRLPPSPPRDTCLSNDESLTPSLFRLGHRYVYAVACQDALLIYDTQQVEPIAYLGGLHYATLTDIAWSPDGCTLLMTSTDGFCSVVSFEKGELGVEAIVNTDCLQQVETPPKIKSPASRSHVTGYAEFETQGSGGNTRRDEQALDMPNETKQSNSAGQEQQGPISKKRRIVPTLIQKNV